MKKLVYITGMGRSGTTILDMALGCHPQGIGLGEVQRVLEQTPDGFETRAFTDRLCSCGMPPSECQFYAPLIEWLKGHNHETFVTKYKYLLEHCEETFGQDRFFVDSSKKRIHIDAIQKHCDMRIIMITRDVRGWIYSMRRRTKSSVPRLAIHWYFSNRRTYKHLLSHQARCIRIGYEELALFPELTLKAVCQELSVAYDSCMLEPRRSKSHILFGNTVSADTEKSRRFFYDCRWLADTEITCWSVFLLPFMRANRRFVYSNFTDGDLLELFSEDRRRETQKKCRAGLVADKTSKH